MGGERQCALNSGRPPAHAALEHIANAELTANLLGTTIEPRSAAASLSSVTEAPTVLAYEPTETDEVTRKYRSDFSSFTRRSARGLRRSGVRCIARARRIALFEGRDCFLD
jgi:hypothetical protein